MQITGQINNLQALFLEEEERNKRIQAQIGYTFENLKLLCQAFTRKSYTEENKNALNNEVLEFYGDKALDFVVMKKMSQRYGAVGESGLYSHSLDEGQLTEIKKNLVCKPMLASRIRALGLEQGLIIGVGDFKEQVWRQESVQEDLFEAILGAVAIDSDWDVVSLEKVVDRMLNPTFYFEQGFDDSVDYVGLVQQWYQKKYKTLPVYHFLDGVCSAELFCEITGVEKNQCDLYIPPFDVFRALGRTKTEAQLSVAKKAYLYLETNNLLISLVDEVGTPDMDRSVNQLQELYQKGYISEPWYDYEEGYDENGNPRWECTCTVDSLKQGFSVTCSSKKQAKKEAAYQMVYLFLGGAE